MEQFIENPGYQHIGQLIFQYLDHKTFLLCRFVCQAWKIFLDDPKFWIRKCTRHKNSRQSLLNASNNYFEKNIEFAYNQEINVSLQLMKIHKIFSSWFKTSSFVIHSKESEILIINFIIENFSEILTEYRQLSNTPVHFAVRNGHLDVVKTMVTCFNNPNAGNDTGWTPIQLAAIDGQSEMIKLLANNNTTNSENINAPIMDTCMTPIEMATRLGHQEVVKLLKEIVI